MNPAKRGDLIVIHQHHRDWSLRGETSEYDTYTVGAVTSVTRDGTVKMFKEAGHADTPGWDGKPDRGQRMPSGFERTLIMSAEVIDVTGALATAACHVWDGSETQVKAYESLDEVRAALKPHLRSGPVSVRLGEAAAKHQVARCEAWEAYLRDRHELGAYDRDRDMKRWDAYVAEVAAVNEAYRAEYAAATA